MDHLNLGSAAVEGLNYPPPELVSNALDRRTQASEGRAVWADKSHDFERIGKHNISTSLLCADRHFQTSVVAAALGLATVRRHRAWTERASRQALAR